MSLYLDLRGLKVCLHRSDHVLRTRRRSMGVSTFLCFRFDGGAAPCFHFLLEPCQRQAKGRFKSFFLFVSMREKAFMCVKLQWSREFRPLYSAGCLFRQVQSVKPTPSQTMSAGNIKCTAVHRHRGVINLWMSLAVVWKGRESRRVYILYTWDRVDWSYLRKVGGSHSQRWVWEGGHAYSVCSVTAISIRPYL